MYKGIDDVIYRVRKPETIKFKRCKKDHDRSKLQVDRREDTSLDYSLFVNPALYNLCDLTPRDPNTFWIFESLVPL